MNPASPLVRPAGRRLIIHGQVQGVGYRHAFKQRALELGIRGWVRNRKNGTVEAEIYGTDEAIAAMIHWSRRGPINAVVSEVEVSEADTPSGDFQVGKTA